jgi:polyisoprenyl-teichoic acid--peptidoglycan teichoic acid transferase
MLSLEQTRPSRSTSPALDSHQPTPVYGPHDWKRPKQNRFRRFGCGFLFILLFVYFLAPFRINFLILGVDDSLGRGNLGRTDTIILTTVEPMWSYVGLLGIPRDLWVQVPNIGEQRINAAYFFAEANQPGAGAPAVVETVSQNFGVTLGYYLVLHMSGLVDFVDALGGVDVTLEAPQGGLPAGRHHLDGIQALAFVRERYSSDDFSRMQQGQIFILAAIRKAIQPATWLRLPAACWALSRVVDTNIPAWQWPRLAFAFLRAMVFGIDMRTVTRDMVTPFQTSGGEQVLAPNWDRIQPLVSEMFGE